MSWFGSKEKKAIKRSVGVLVVTLLAVGIKVVEMTFKELEEADDGGEEEPARADAVPERATD